MRSVQEKRRIRRDFKRLREDFRKARALAHPANKGEILERAENRRKRRIKA